MGLIRELRRNITTALGSMRFFSHMAEQNEKELKQDKPQQIVGRGHRTPPLSNAARQQAPVRARSTLFALC
jgi:hypothetical protein